MCEDLELIEILSRQPKCQRALMTDRVLRLFFEMIRLVDHQLERIVVTRDPFARSDGIVGRYNRVKRPCRVVKASNRNFVINWF